MIHFDVHQNLPLNALKKKKIKYFHYFSFLPAKYYLLRTQCQIIEPDWKSKQSKKQIFK